MTITLDIKPEVKAARARQAAVHGSAVEAYAATLLEEAAHLPPRPEPVKAPAAAAVVEACERLNTFGKRHGLSLGGMTIRELRHEARP